MSTNSILNTFQSGFRVQHSTETALLKVLNDIYLSVHSGDFVVLLLLDLSAAFDTIYHSILISRLECCIGLQGNVLKWFTAYLTNRSFSVNIANFTSSTAPLTCGVPQGSILAPTLFSLYMLPLCDILEKHGISFHCYADDTQLYIPIKKGSINALEILTACLQDLTKWIS